MYLFEFFSQLILSATLFYKMGSGSQSGKLLFRRFYSGSNVVIQDGPNTMTISNTFTQNPIITDVVAIGTGDNITNSYSGPLPGFTFDLQLIFQNGALAGNTLLSFNEFSVISNYGVTTSGKSYGYRFPNIKSLRYGKSNITKSTCNSMIISGFNNNMGTGGIGSDNLILGGQENILYSANWITTYNQVSIIGGTANTILPPSVNKSLPLTYKSNQKSSIIGGAFNLLFKSYNSTILGGSNNCLISPGYTGSVVYSTTICNSTIISGSCNVISGTISIDETGKGAYVRNNSIISGCRNKILPLVDDSLIISSDDSLICVSSKFTSEQLPSARNLIISSQTASISSYNNNKFPACNNLIVSAVESHLYNTFYGTIIGGCHSSIIGTAGSPHRNNSIISSERSCILISTLGRYNSIISSRNSCLGSGFTSSDSFQQTTILGGENHCTIALCPTFNNLFCQSTIIGGRNNTMHTFDSVVLELNPVDGALIIGGSGLSSSSVTIGGICNTTYGCRALIVGGQKNFARTGQIVGGKCNKSIRTDSAFIGCVGSMIIGSYCSINCGEQSPILFGCCHLNYGSLSFGRLRNNILGGEKNSICFSTYGVIIGGKYNFDSSDVSFPSLTRLFFIGGCCNKLDFTDQGSIQNSGFIGGFCNRIFNGGSSGNNKTLQNTSIIGGTAICTSESNSMVVQNFWVSGTMSTGSKDHFTQSFTYSLDGITGNFLNPSNIRFVNGIIVAIDGQKVDYNNSLVFKVNPQGTPPGVTFSLTNVTSPEVLVQWGEGVALTYSGTNITIGRTYSTSSSRQIKIYGTFSGFTHSTGGITEFNDYNTVNRITVTGSTTLSIDMGVFSSVTNWQYVNFSRNSLSVSAVNSILVHLDSLPIGTVTDVLLFSQSTPAIPTGAGSASRAQLLSEGVNVITDWF